MVCPICGNSEKFSLVDKVNGFTLFHCNSCNLEFTESMHYDPMYYEHLHYAQDYNLNSILTLSRQDFLDRAGRLLEDKDWVPHNIVFKWLENNFKKGSTILDIGCGVGWFLAALESRGYKAIGIEVSTQVVEMLKNKGLQVYLGPFEAIDNEMISPDLVVLLGVIEHVQDPVGLLRNIHRKFPKAQLLISIPSPRRWDFGIGIRNYWDYPPNHLTPFWSEKSLGIALSNAGFTLDEWIFPKPAPDELWFVFLDRIFTRLGMRRKGYFVGLTNEVDTSRNFFKDAVKLFYPILEKINLLAAYIAKPLLALIIIRLIRKGYSGLSAFAIAKQKKVLTEGLISGRSNQLSGL